MDVWHVGELYFASVKLLSPPTLPPSPPLSRLDTGLAPGRKRAYLLYKQAMKEAAAQAKEAEKASDVPVVATPHPYVLALGVISIQKVCVETCSSS